MWRRLFPPYACLPYEPDMLRPLLSAACAIPLWLFVLPLAAADPEGFRKSLFNGQDLSGWKVTDCEVAVEDGLLVLK
jgi:hypothetical protein